MLSTSYQANVGIGVGLRAGLCAVGSVLQNAFDGLGNLFWPALLLIGAVWLCLLYPMLPVGLAITAVVGLVTYPRSPRTGGWDQDVNWGRRDRHGVSWNSKAVCA